MCADSVLVLASRHMLLCSISAAEAFQGMQGDNRPHKDRNKLTREILDKAFSPFLCCLLGICLLPLACGVNIQTLAVMHPSCITQQRPESAGLHEQASPGLRAGWPRQHSERWEPFSSVALIHIGFIQLNAGWESMKDLFSCFNCPFWILNQSNSKTVLEAFFFFFF